MHPSTNPLKLKSSRSQEAALRHLRVSFAAWTLTDGEGGVPLASDDFRDADNNGVAVGVEVKFLLLLLFELAGSGSGAVASVLESAEGDERKEASDEAPLLRALTGAVNSAAAAVAGAGGGCSAVVAGEVPSRPTETWSRARRLPLVRLGAMDIARCGRIARLHRRWRAKELSCIVEDSLTMSARSPRRSDIL